MADDGENPELFPGGEDSAAVAEPIAESMNDATLDNAIADAGGWGRRFGDLESTTLSVIDGIGFVAGAAATVGGAPELGVLGLALSAACELHTRFGWQPFQFPHAPAADVVSTFHRATAEYVEDTRPYFSRVGLTINSPTDLSQISRQDPRLRVPVKALIDSTRTPSSRVGAFALSLTKRRSVWIQRQSTLFGIYVRRRPKNIMTIFTAGITQETVNKQAQNASSYYSKAIASIIQRGAGAGR